MSMTSSGMRRNDLRPNVGLRRDLSKWFRAGTQLCAVPGSLAGVVDRESKAFGASRVQRRSTSTTGSREVRTRDVLMTSRSVTFIQVSQDTSLPL
eukprot:scaffold2537_cov304-Pinguiococcus_pyrenoidosus.AAC.1